MTERAPATIERLHDLLADQATQGLSSEETAELTALLDRFPDVDAYSFDLTAAAVDLPEALGDLEPMPASVRDRVEASSIAWLAEQRGLSVAPAPTVTMTGSGGAIVGWLAAAACLALALIAWWPQRPTSPVDLFAALKADATSTTVAWNDAERVVTGDIVWNNDRQAGVMRLRGLAANDPTKMQYQLWIFDRSRQKLATADGVTHPAVDGGVFDVTRDGEDVYVKVDAKLEVGAPYLFAITTEPPGGVVEHIDEGPYRIILTAPVEG
ncbi:MAG: anti-sigma factor domain-containing protein [Planctomycetota bacterium]|jgi:hypothetical protein